MEQGYQNSRKRTCPLNALHSPQHCHSRCQDECCHDNGAKATKRARAEQSQRDLSYRDILMGSVPDGRLYSSNYQENLLQSSFDFDTSSNGLSMFPPAQHFPSDDQRLPQYAQRTGISTTTPSTTYAGTSDTLSPRLHNDQDLVDIHDSASLSQALPGEQSLAGLGGFNLDCSDDGFMGGQHGSLLELSDIGWREPSAALQMQQVNDNAILGAQVVSAIETFPEVPITVPGFLASLIYKQDPPWSYGASFGVGVISPPPAQSSQPESASPAERPAAAKLNLKLQPLAPKKECPGHVHNYRWTNVTPNANAPQNAENGKRELDIGRIPGRRCGPLKPGSKHNAKLVRSARSCWSCKISKTTCSVEIPCKRCSGMSPSICYKWHAETFSNLLSPNDLLSRFSQSTIDYLMKKNVRGFTNNTTEVELSSGPRYPKIRITVHEFIPSNQDFLALEYVATDKITDRKAHTFAKSYAPPWALSDFKREDLRNDCCAHIESIVERERDFSETTQGDISMVSWRVFEAVNRYRKANKRFQKDPLLLKGVMLHAMHYFLSRIILLTDDSAEKAVSSLTSPPKLPFKRTLTSTLLQLQVKEAMQTLLQKTLGEVAEGYEKALSAGSKKPSTSWAGLFCIVLILCMSIEAAQVARDGCAMAEILDDPACKLSRADLCFQLDEKAFEPITNMFHKAFKTDKKRNSKSGFNPFRDDIKVNAREKITQPMVDLVNEIKQIMKDKNRSMKDAVNRPTFDDRDPLTHHMAFRKRNSGRLLSKFLLYFVDS